jgi:ribosomal protein S18 acetylase RimI-like enzyme
MSSTASVLVRDLQPDDRRRWNELWNGYLAFYRQELSSAITDLTWRRLLDPGQPLQGLLALDESGNPVGLVHYHVHLSTWAVNGYCYLEDLFVDPACRGQGTGRALIEAVYRAADAQGAERVYWHTENTNERAQALYRQMAELSPFVQYRRPRAP